jgi:hypothetical protein
MSTAEATELVDVLDRVKNWSPESRIVLARRILETLEAPNPDISSVRGPAVHKRSPL